MNVLRFLNSIAGQKVGSWASGFGSVGFLFVTFRQKVADGWPTASTYIEGWEMVAVVAACAVFGMSVRAALGLERRTITIPSVPVPENQEGPPPPVISPPAALEQPEVPEAPDRTPPPVNPTTMSQAGLDMLKRFEGWRAEPYICSGGRRTVGYGHVILPDDDLSFPLSKAEGERLLDEDNNKAEQGVDRGIAVPLNQAQFDCLVSFAFNVGVGQPKTARQKGTGFLGSTLLRRLNNGEYDAVPSELNRWINAGGRPDPGLMRRREAEGRLFAAGEYPKNW